MDLITALNDVDRIRMSADVTTTSNGEGAKTAKVSIVARTTDPTVYGDLGRVVHDFSGMTAPSRIPLDWEHGGSISDGIGYLNKFDPSSGDLVASGVIVQSDDQTQKLVTNMIAGVPYQASIDHAIDDDTLVEYVPEGVTTTVNGQALTGPLTVFREWNLRAVALCKYGVDAGTSAQVMMSLMKNVEPAKGLLIRFRKNRGMATMTDNKVEPAKVEETKAVEAPVETVAVPAPVVDPVAKADEPVEEKKAETPVVVEATKTEVAPAPVVEQVQMSARNEFKSFVAEFGNEKAATYFADGLSMSAASLRYAKEIKTENDDLKKRLASLDRGAEKPVKMSKANATADEKQPEKPSLINFAGKKNK